MDKLQNTEIKAVVWSKLNCSHCDQAKNLLMQHGIEFEERRLEEGWTKEQLLEAVPNARTMPQIFIDNVLIGGYQELRAKLGK